MAKIMIVDDSKLMRKKLSDIVTAMGHTVVHECETGEKALVSYVTYKPDLVTMDINMPGISGIEATSQIRKNYSNAKIIIISSENQEASILQGIRAGAISFLVKPFRDDHVQNSVNKALADVVKKEKNEKKAQLYRELNYDENITGLILLVDDSKLVLKATSDMLKKDGHSVLTADTGKKGLELAQNGAPDVILLDIVMPDIDGYQVMKELRKDEITRNIPVIMYSSLTKKEDILLAMKLGIADYISKNCDPLIFSGKIRSALVEAKIQKLKLEENSINNVIVTRDKDSTLISFRYTLKSEAAIAERKKVFTGAFLHSIKNSRKVLDFRQINEMDSTELSQVVYIFSHFHEQELFIICGKHLGAFAAEFDMEGINHFFITRGDMELYIQNIKSE